MTDLNQLTAMYIKLRDEKATRKKAYEESVAALDEGMKRLEVAMLGLLTKQGAESVRTDAGTVYRSKKSTCHVADWDALLKFVQDNQFWHMLKKDIAKKAVDEFREEKNDLPPGLDWREEFTVGVRRA